MTRVERKALELAYAMLRSGRGDMGVCAVLTWGLMGTSLRWMAFAIRDYSEDMPGDDARGNRLFRVRLALLLRALLARPEYQEA